MKSVRGSIKERLVRLELQQRERAVRDWASVLANYEAFTADQNQVVLQQLIQWFQEEHKAGVLVTTSLDKLPDPFKTEVYKVLIARLDKEASPSAQGPSCGPH